MAEVELTALAGFGLEAVVARELRHLGYDDPGVADGRVTIRTGLEAVCRLNLWLRSAERVLLRLGSFAATDFGALFDGTRALPWADWLPPNACFPVRGKSVRSQLHSVPACQSIVKKAIVEALRAGHGVAQLPEDGPLYSVEVSLLKDQVTLSLDASGPGLHKRGYRTLATPTPLKETLAAGLVQLSHWSRERAFVDPFAGSGTIPIEAALIGHGIAPGLQRSFAAEAWPQLPAGAWQRAREEARDLASPEPVHTLIGSDVDEEVLGIARHHARRAGVADSIHFQRARFEDLTSARRYGCLVTNPPYGERTRSAYAVRPIYAAMPAVFRRLETWSIYVLTSHPDFERQVGRRAERRRKLYNGGIACTYFQYPGPRPPRRRIVG